MSGGVTPTPTPRYDRIIGASFEVAWAMHHDYVGVEHLFLAIIHDPDTVPTQALADIVELDEVEAHLREIINSTSYTTPTRKLSDQPIDGDSSSGSA